jgi:hypothetical protein
VHPSSAPSDLLGDDQVAAYDGAIASFESTLAGTDDLSRPVVLPFATVPGRRGAAHRRRRPPRAQLGSGHGHRQPFDPPVEFVEAVEPFYTEFISLPLRDGDTFAEAVVVGADATPIERLVAFAGREV